MTNPISSVNILVTAGSTDGMAAAAACLRHSGNPTIKLVFTQAFQVDKVDISQWPPESNVGFIDLGVNNEGPSPNPQMTIDFVKKIYMSGHKILFIADEHDKKAWHNALTQCEHDKSELSIRPKDRGQKYPSSCAILKKALGETADFHTQQLLQDGNKADQMNFNTPFGKIFNEGVKSNLADPQRRPYMVQYMAQHDTPDTKIQGWMNEYVQMEANLPKILASRHDLGDGISSYDGTIGRHDATAIFKEAYKEGPIVVLTGTTVFIEGKMQVGVSIATNNPNLNVLKIIQNANILASGMPAKANFALENEQAAINAVRAAIALQ